MADFLPGSMPDRDGLRERRGASAFTAEIEL